MDTYNEQTNRRDFLALSATGAAFLALATPHARAAEVNPKLEDHEKENVRLVTEFCESWATMDVDKIAGYLADDVTFRMIDTAPFVEGKTAMIEGIKQFLAERSDARFELLRSDAIGNVVINERIDHFERKDGSDAFHVTGFFLVKDGKIAEWRDYMMPRLG